MGAPVPASISANQDASKLRHRLTKTGRNTTSSSEIPLRSDAKSEEEEEEKGKLKKRLMKLDPFERKKRRKIEIPPKIPISKINGHIQGINGKDRKEVLKPKISKEKASHGQRDSSPSMDFHLIMNTRGFAINRQKTGNSGEDDDDECNS